MGRSLALSAILGARASDGSSVSGLIDPSDRERGTERTSKTLTGQKTSRDRDCVHVEGRWAPLHLNGVEDGPGAHSDAKGLGNNEALDRVTND